ncbi:hypothetical protein Xcel_2837 [Xylanimonas cellulosilytica DSM 15894]|uniref:Uncharacterized protein n=1 Tax=Xylanimonas cellulosilytica (strain DSM 15894 / JCM 12276 / CECT 5975 / KCTC 9989 / LMG 20990 / NBRC 107835 / XIL07) TaxID=446471 RepID=D1BYH9_XYLCX|nr:hypothetical protein [Xylanimonas cellulosilytica]ACZ31851.1 hypothetical protein Xcel_2837 [Xylanimonas cellulosilytica DSM 15894]
MARPLGRRRLAAAAALAVLGLLLAILGQASASHLHVEADGNLVWSRAWPDSPPDPPVAPVPTAEWQPWFAEHEHDCLQHGSSAIGASFPLVEDFETVRNYDVVLVSDSGYAKLPGNVDNRIQNWGIVVAVDVQAGDVKTAFVGVTLDPMVIYEFVLEVRRPDHTVAARSAKFWWGWTGSGAHTSVTKPSAWSPPGCVPKS